MILIMSGERRRHEQRGELAARGRDVGVLSRRVPAAAADAGQRREPQVQRLPVRHPHRADQLAPRHRAAPAPQGPAHRRQQRAQIGRRSTQGHY